MIDLKNKNYSHGERLGISILEISAYLYAFASMAIRKESNYDFITLISIAIAIVISFSEQGLVTQKINDLMNSKSVFRTGIIGKLSIALFFADVPARQITCLILPESLWWTRFRLDMIILFLISMTFILVDLLIHKYRIKAK